MTIYNVTSSSSVFDNNNDTRAFFKDSPAADTLNVGAGAYLITSGDATNTGDSAAAFLAGKTGPWTVAIDGALYSDIDTGLFLSAGIDPSKTSTIKVGADGEVGGAYMGIYAGSVVAITNAGVISGRMGYGIDIEGGGKNSIVNSGAITSAANAIYEINSTAMTLTNSGDITGTVTLGNGVNKIANSGLIDGSLTGGDGGNTLTNSGHISGYVTFGKVANTITNSGDIYGVTLGDGNNTVTNSGSITNLGTGKGNDTVTLTATGRVGGTLDLGAGDNKLTSSGLLGELLAGDGNDTVTLTGTGSVDSIDLGGGNNKFTFTNTGTPTKPAAVTFGAGNDLVSNGGQLGDVDLGDGNNKLTNSGRIGSVSAGDGADVVTNTGAGVIFNPVSLGKGNDSFTGGSQQDQFRDGDGSDTANLGGGDDSFGGVGAAGGDGNDTVDGGAGRDTYVSSGDGFVESVFINLDTVAHADGGKNIAANTAYGLDVSGVADGTVVDKVKNFEDVYGTTADDIIYGSSGNNIIDAGGGADKVFGYGGNDTIYGYGEDDLLSGGAGNDTLDGGEGKDTLIGGAGADLLIGTGDSAIDTYLFLTPADSGLSKANRDTINGFEDGFDVIDVSALGASHFLGANKAFVAAADVRAISTATGWTIEGDIGGDGKADFSIVVVDPQHGITWDTTDFVLI